MSGVPVPLREWETVRPDPGSPTAGRTLDGGAIRNLAQRLTERGQIEVLELARGLELRATSFVGRINLGDLTITIQPKLAGAPFLHLLRYAYGLRNLHLYEPVGYASTKWTFQDLLLLQLAAEASELLARGAHRDYERTQAELMNPRGRIDFARFVGMVSRARGALPCVHHPRTDDNILNQALLAGLIYASRLSSNGDLRDRLGRLANIFSTTVSNKRLDASMMAEARRAMDRRTNAYEPALLLIELLLQGEGVLLDGEATRARLPGFLFDMNRFFQRLISRFLHEYLDGYEIHDECRLKEVLFYDSDRNRNPQGRRAPSLKPDFVIRRNHTIMGILDAKYRDLWEKPLPREMLYQLAVYALSQRGGECQSVILYPTLTEEAGEQAILIRAPLGGAPQAEIILRPVELLKLEKLLRNRDWLSTQKKRELANYFSFGQSSIKSTVRSAMHFVA